MTRALASCLLLVVTLACGGTSSTEPSPYEVCKADASPCCADSECAEGQVCDFAYICSVMGDHSVACSGGTGSRTCLDACADDGTCADPALTCVEREQFQGGDYAPTYRLCVSEVRDGDRPVARVGREQRGRYTLVWLAGSPYEMGQQHGQLLHDELAGGVEAIGTDPTLKVMFAAARAKGLLDLARDASYPELLEECRGMVDAAADVGWTEEMCLLLNFGDMVQEFLIFGVPEAARADGGCSQAIVSGPATADGRLYHARTLDWFVIDFVVEHPVLFVRQPTGGLAHVVIGFPGNLSPYQGMNEKGLVLASNQVDPIDASKDSLTGRSHVQLLAKALAEAGSLAEARALFLGEPDMTFEAIGASDPTAGEIFEVSPPLDAVRTQQDGVAILTNHFVAPGTSDLDEEPPSEGSRRRLARLQALVPKDGAETLYGTFTPEVLARVLRDRVNPDDGTVSAAGVVDDDSLSLATNGALYQVIFDPAGLRFWVAAGVLPVPEQPMTGFSLATLLNRKGYDGFPTYDLP